MDDRKMLEIFKETMNRRDCTTCRFREECKDGSGNRLEADDLCTLAAEMALEAFETAVLQPKSRVDVRCPSCGEGFIFDGACNLCGQVVLL